jgi:tRNA(Leu) C34 or U34 (ribose-2'-O)-methylase TrmL
MLNLVLFEPEIPNNTGSSMLSDYASSVSNVLKALNVNTKNLKDNVDKAIDNLPEIPNNTGSLIRLSANMGASLHLIKPFGFEITDKRLRRAGLDYKELAQVFEYENFEHYLDKAKPERHENSINMINLNTFSPCKPDLSPSLIRHNGNTIG